MRPTLQQLAAAVHVAADVLDAHAAMYCFEARFAFALEAGWNLHISPDDAGRFRLDAVLAGRVRASMWCRVDDHERLAELVTAARDEASALV